MIYLTLDTNIWLDLLEDSWGEDNIIDKLEYWLKHDFVKILVPEIIIEEWERNKKGVKYDKLNNDFDTFLKISQDVLPESFIYELRDKNYQAVIFETQIQRIETIICNAVKLRLSDTVRDQIILQGVQRKAPMQKKSSIGDAIIIYTLFDFAQKQQQDYFYFISRDADFCKDGQIHEDLRDKFDALNIVHFIKLKKCISDIERKFGFKDDPNAEERRKSRLKNRLKKVVYNPEYEKLVTGTENSFILNCEIIDIIVKQSKPTKEQVLFVLALVDSDTTYEKYFFERVSSTVWFGILKQKGVFEVGNCPRTARNDNSTNTSVWYPLRYIITLCDKHIDEIDGIIGNDILEIIEKVTKSDVENHTVWYDFLQVLIKLPNERITTSVLEHVGRWFLDEHSKHYSYVLIEELIPKFLSDNPNAQDVEKAKILLKLIFRIEERRDSHITNYWGKEDSYRLLVDIEHTKDFLYKKNYFVNIVKYCPEIIFDATESLNKLHLDFGDGLKINLESDTSVVTLTVKSNGTDFWLFISENKPFDKEKIEQESTQLVRTSDTVPLHNSESEIEQYVLRYLHENNIAIIDHVKNKEEIRYLCENLKNGKEYIGLFSGSLDEYIEGSLNSNRPVEILSFIFIEILKEMIQSKADFTVSVLKSFISESKYSLTFYKKVAIYIIGQNWESGKELFWSFADLETFTTPTYKRDILNLLQKHQNKFTESEIGVLSDIISSMDSYVQPYRQNRDIRYYQRTYYANLRSIEKFRIEYEELSRILNIPQNNVEDAASVDEPYVRVIIEKDELLKKEVQGIVELISTLPNDNSSDQRAIYNFSQTFSDAVSQEPNKFVDEIDRFNKVPCLFVYQVARGLENAWKNKMPFNWEKVVDFFTKYTLNEDFGTDKFIIPLYMWNIDGQNVLGAVADLLREGMRDDANAFEISLLPKVKNLLISSFVKAEAVDLEIQDSLSYSLNSTFGKILISIVEYSLRRARKMSNENAFEKWEDEIKGLFDRALEKEIIDAYNVVGMYFPQLCYLDKEWTFGKIQDFFDKDEKLWFGFFINFVFYNKYRSKEIYNLFYKHYQRAIKSNFEQKRLYSKGIIPQLLIFYFASIENLYEEGLFPLFLNNIKSSELIDLVRYITYNYESILDVTDGNTEMTQSKIYDLWKMIPDKTHILSDKDKNEVMVKLIEWLQYVELLNEDFTFLILKSVPHIDTYYNISHLVENLTRLMDNGGKYDNSQYISRILKLLTFKYYISNTNKAHLATLVNFIYQWGEKIDADEICNIVAKNGHDFLHDTYLNNRERE